MANPLSKAWTAGARGLRWMIGTPPLPLPMPFREQGVSGTAVWGGYPAVKETSSKWIGYQRWITASELMVNTSVIAAGIHYFLNLISNPKWIAAPKDPNSAEAKEMADFVNDVLANTETPWANIVRQAGMFRFHGFSIQEWIACNRPDGTIGIKNIEVRPQHTIEQWAVDDFGKVLGAFQRNPQNGRLVGLPRSKMVYLVEDTLTDSPEGLGVLRNLLEPYERLRQLQNLEVRAYERDMRGIPIARAPLAAINQAVKSNVITQADADRMIQGLKDMVQTQVKQSDTGVLMDSQPYFSTTMGGPAVSAIPQWDFQLLNGPGLGLLEIAAAIERIQREIARVMGIEHLLLGDGGGSRAVAQDKSRNVYLIASSVLRTIVANFNNDLISALWALNGFDDRTKPKLMSEDIAPKDTMEVTTALARMSQAGAVLAPDDPAVDEVRDMLGLSHAPKETPVEEGGLILSDPVVTAGLEGPGIPLPKDLMPIGVVPAPDKPLERTLEVVTNDEDEDPEVTPPVKPNGKKPPRAPSRGPNERDRQGRPRGNKDELQRLPRSSDLMSDPV